MYQKFFKRLFDFIGAMVAIIVLSPLFLVLIIVGTVEMKGNPFFVQPRPGKGEKIFNLIKFRSMTSETDSNGKLLPDEVRLTKYGKFLRATSLDELPELINIIKGEMSFVGPRPQLVRDMVFMTQKQRMRHSVIPGLTGLAQINGRNNISWEDKFRFDLEYIEEGITFVNDLKIVFYTVFKAFIRADIVREGTASDLDFGDYLLSKGDITEEEYTLHQKEAKELLEV